MLEVMEVTLVSRAVGVAGKRGAAGAGERGAAGEATVAGMGSTSIMSKGEDSERGAGGGLRGAVGGGGAAAAPRTMRECRVLHLVYDDAVRANRFSLTEKAAAAEAHDGVAVRVAV